jgi:DNA-binding PadR family transcriptional regulator
LRLFLDAEKPMQISEPAEYAMLGLLEDRPMHGYEMFQQFESGTLRQIVHLEMSQMYAYLKKLERLEYIEAQVEPQGARPPRRVLQITAAGRDLFHHWLTEPVEKPRDIRLLFLIKLYFMQRIMPDQSPYLVDRQIIACVKFLEHLASLHPTAAEAGDMAFFDHVVLRSRIYQTRALLEWLRELQQELAGAR